MYVHGLLLQLEAEVCCWGILLHQTPQYPNHVHPDVPHTSVYIGTVTQDVIN